MRARHAGSVALLLVALVAAPAAAQFEGGVALRAEAVTIDEPDSIGVEWIALAMTPWDASLAVRDWGVLSVGGAWAIAHIEGAGSASEELLGLTDTHIAFDVFLGRRALLSINGLVPTGKTKLEPNEFGLSGVLAAQSLPFSMASWGTGGRIGADIAYDASPSTTTRITLLTGFHFGRSYEPLDAVTLEYRPGNEFNLRAAVEQYFKGVTFGLTLGMQRFGEDQVQSQNLFQAGTRTQAVLTVLFPIGETGSAAAWGSMTSRGGGVARTDAVSVLDGALDTPSQDLLQAGLTMRLPAGGIVLVPEIDTRLFRRDDGTGEGMLTGIGITAELPISRTRRGGRVFLAPTLRARTGHVEHPARGTEVGMKAYEFSLALRWEAGR